jgi:hypothetical protein
MQQQRIVSAIAAGALIVAAGLVLRLARGPADEPPPVAQPGDNLRPTPTDVEIARAEAEPGAPTPDALAAAKVRELEAMSETFRNTTFLIAIRDSGFICYELLRVYGGINDSATWTATCSEMLAYTVRVGGGGQLHVEPTLEILDSVVPWTAPRESDSVVPILPPPTPR